MKDAGLFFGLQTQQFLGVLIFHQINLTITIISAIYCLCWIFLDMLKNLKVGIFLGRQILKLEFFACENMNLCWTPCH